MFAHEDCPDLQVGEEEKAPKESWDRQVEVESKELWDHRVYTGKRETKEMSGHRVSQELKVSLENLFLYQK